MVLGNGDNQKMATQSSSSSGGGGVDSDDLENKTTIGVMYMLSMGICGTIIVALGSTLEALASNVGTTATNLGTVFIARGIG